MMIKFNLGNFEPVPEGERLLKITDAKCTPSGKPSKMEVTFTDIKTNRTIKSSYRFDINGSLMAMGFLCRIALNIPDMGEFDTKDCNKLIGKTLLCDVVHTEGTQEREDGTLPIFANVKKVLELVDESTGEVVETEKASPRASVKTALDDLD